MVETKQAEAKATPDPVAAAPAPEQKKLVQPLLQSSFKPREYAITDYAVFPVFGTTIEDLKDPIYWASVAQQLKPYDKLYVYPEGGSYYAELLVVAATARAAMVETITFLALDKKIDDFAADSDFTISYRNPNTQFVVIRKSDQTVLKDGLRSQEDAALWLAEHKKVIARR